MITFEDAAVRIVVVILIIASRLIGVEVGAGGEHLH